MPASQTITRLSFAFLMTILRGIPFVPVAAASPKPQKPCRTTPLLRFTVFIALIVTAPASASSLVLLPAHTLVPMVATDHLKSGHSKEGDDVSFRTFAAVYGLHHEVLIPAGSQGHGKVTESKGCGMAGKGGKLKFTCEFVVAGDGTHIALSNADLSRQGRTYNPVTMLLTGGVLSLFSNGKDIDVDEGTPFIMEVGTDASLAPVQDTPLGVVQIVPNKHKVKGHPATILSFSADPITVTTDTGETTLKLKDVKQILLPPQAKLISSAPIAAMPVAVPAAAAPAPQSLFTFQNGTQTTGTLISFDGTLYTVSTPKGMRRFRAAGIKSIQATSR